MRRRLLLAAWVHSSAVSLLLEEAGLERFGSSALRSDCAYEDLYPRQYVSYKTAGLSPDALDGDLTKAAWLEVPWTEDFIDISTSIKPRHRTRAKMRWDDRYLYVGAELDEPDIWGTLQQDDTVIFNDNDFEVFVDPNSTTHFYKEFEMNTLNSRWTLCLDKPYSDGGGENSTRVDKKRGWSMLRTTRTAVRVNPPAALNNPSVKGKTWTVEIALPLASLIDNNTDSLPQHGSFWRVGFSRVEWNVEADKRSKKYVKRPKCQSCPEPGTAHEDNWVWSTQGEVNMHAPERWGLVQFSDQQAGTTPLARFDRWPSHSAAMAVYYAQRKYAQDHGGSFASNLADLLPYSAPPFELCSGADVKLNVDRPGRPSPSYEAFVRLPGGPAWEASIRNDRYLTVSRTGA